MCAASVFWRRNSMMKSGTVQVRPTSRNRFSHRVGGLPRQHCLLGQWRSNGDHAKEHFHAQSMSGPRHHYRSAGGHTDLMALPHSSSWGRTNLSHVQARVAGQLIASAPRRMSASLHAGQFRWEGGAVNAPQLSCWIRNMNPARDLCNRGQPDEKITEKNINKFESYRTRMRRGEK